ADGRGDFGGGGERRADAADAGARVAGAAGERAVSGGVHEQGGHGGRPGDFGLGGARGAGAVEEVPVSGGRDSGDTGAGDRGGGGGDCWLFARGGRQRGSGARASAREAWVHHPAQAVQGRGVCVDQGGGGAAHAVFQRVPAAILSSDDGRDGGGDVAGGGGDG